MVTLRSLPRMELPVTTLNTTAYSIFTKTLSNSNQIKDTTSSAAIYLLTNLSQRSTEFVLTCQVTMK